MWAALLFTVTILVRMEPMNDVKCCSHCERKKPIEAFNRSTVLKGGLQAWCRSCFSEYNRTWSSEHRRVRIKKESM